MGTEMKRALLFGSVPCGDGAFLRPYLDGGGWTVFCADGGVRNARAAGLRPDYLIGDWGLRRCAGGPMSPASRFRWKRI